MAFDEDSVQTLEEHVATYDCPECGESVTSKEMIEHGYRHDEWPFADKFPEHYICEHNTDNEQSCVNVYLRIVSETGPFYIVRGEDPNFVDEVDAYELLRHDWEFVKYEQTPFTKFVETEDT